MLNITMYMNTLITLRESYSKLSKYYYKMTNMFLFLEKTVYKIFSKLAGNKKKDVIKNALRLKRP